MFGRGNRFPQPKPSDIPGPGAYDPRDPDYDAYKHGAFLEKDERFLKEKPSDVPGFGAYSGEPVQVKKSSAQLGKTGTSDRYALLQRKVEELERIHAESKKSHQAEVDRLKSELSRAQRTTSEQSDRIDKLKKQVDAADARAQELRKTNLSDQSEIKDLRAKLRVAAHERAKQSEAGDARKAVQALDARRREEARERDRKIAELEKAVGAERRRREAAEGRFAEASGSADVALRTALEAKTALDAELRDTRSDGEQARAALAALRARTQGSESELLAQLDQHRLLLSQVAAEYGRLAATSIPRVAHERVQSQSRVLQVRVSRLERKLANSEDQVVELANLIRGTKEHSTLVANELREAEKQLSVYSTMLQDGLSERPEDLRDLQRIQGLLDDVGQTLLKDHADTRQVLVRDFDAWASHDRTRLDLVLLHSSVLGHQIDEASHLVQRRSRELAEADNKISAMAIELATARAEQEVAKTRWADTVAEVAVAQAREESLRKELQSVKADKKAELAKLQHALREEKDTTQKLASVVQASKAAEDALNQEIQLLTTELAEAEKYQEAYASLIEEVDSLVDKNALAEDEAQRLSSFNAQILGHHNPAQRIMYVDRIRQELHDTKLELLSVTRERDGALDENDELRHELDMYTSVVPQQSKPRTTVTRVARVPLAAHSLNGQSLFLSKGASNVRAGSAKLGSSESTEAYKEGDMTLDEIS